MHWAESEKKHAMPVRVPPWFAQTQSQPASQPNRGRSLAQTDPTQKRNQKHLTARPPTQDSPFHLSLSSTRRRATAVISETPAARLRPAAGSWQPTLARFITQSDAPTWSPPATCLIVVSV